MKRELRSLAAALAVMLSAAVSPFGASAADKLDFTYNTGNDASPLFHGYKKAEIYDVAIRICNPLLTGSRVTGISVYIPGDESSIAECSGWVSSALKLVTQSGKKINAPDLASAEGSRDAAGVLNVSFPEPVVIPEEGLYVGYTFRVAELNDVTATPVAYVAGDDPDGLYIHTTRSISSWKSIVSQVEGVSPLTVRLSGDFPDIAAGVEMAPSVYVPVGKADTPEATVWNWCSEPISSIGYTYTVGDREMHGELNLTEPLNPVFGASARLRLPLEAQAEAGTYPFRLSIDKVNGHPNDISAVHEGDITVMPFIPVNRPLVEEYTGLWCGYCPAGYVAMEQMNDRYGERFIGMVYHDNDPMTAVESYPTDISGFPSVVINRGLFITGVTPETIDASWQEVSADYALADISVDGHLDEADGKTLIVNSSSRFVRDFSGGRMRLSYALVADGLSDSSWIQSNNYSGDQKEGKYWDLFTKASGKVRGLTFNDVVALYCDFNGVENSLPDEIKADTELSHSFRIDLSEAFFGKMKEVVKDSGRLRVVAMIVDTATGRVINANTTGSFDGAGVSAPADDASVVAEKYYNLDGTPVSAPEKGKPCLRITVFSDGTCLTRKILATF